MIFNFRKLKGFRTVLGLQHFGQKCHLRLKKSMTAPGALSRKSLKGFKLVHIAMLSNRILLNLVKLKCLR